MSEAEGTSQPEFRGLSLGAIRHIRAAVESDFDSNVALYDAEGRRVGGADPSAPYVADVLTEILEGTLQRMPRSGFSSPDETREALQAALTKVLGVSSKERQTKYEVDMATGELKLKFISGPAKYTATIKLYQGLATLASALGLSSWAMTKGAWPSAGWIRDLFVQETDPQGMTPQSARGNPPAVGTVDERHSAQTSIACKRLVARVLDCYGWDEVVVNPFYPRTQVRSLGATISIKIAFAAHEYGNPAKAADFDRLEACCRKAGASKVTQITDADGRAIEAEWVMSPDQLKQVGS
jgi:hypothetical protein